MRRYSRGTSRGANNGNAADMGTMFTDLMREMLRDVQRAAPNAGNGGGPIVQASRANFAKLNKDYTSLGGKPFHGTESTTDVQDWLDSCDRVGYRGCDEEKASVSSAARASDELVECY